MLLLLLQLSPHIWSGGTTLEIRVMAAGGEYNELGQQTGNGNLARR